MDPTAIAKYTPQEKRVFPGSSSSPCMDPDVIEIDPPSADEISKFKSKSKGKRKENASYEIIDVDMDEDCSDVVIIDARVECNSKRKKSSMGISLGPSSASQSNSKTMFNSASTVKSNKKGKEVPVERYECFKKFDTVVDYSDHFYSKQNAEMKQPPKKWAKRIQEEWRILEKDLPDTIFVRVYESRMDILRAAIIGAEGTPYHDGLFFFDVCFPSDYPNSPPRVQYHSGGLGINPNLYKDGNVCLSLLNTWRGSKQENWIPGTSTMLQVLVSIQGLILNTKPYFNEPGFAHFIGTTNGEKQSLLYNEKTLILSIKTMVYTMNKPPKNFEDLVVVHFRKRISDILMACKAYMEGVQVGCFVRGGVQNVVDEGDNKCSDQFKDNVSSYMKTLIAAFKKIGANEADEFLNLSEKKFYEPLQHYMHHYQPLLIILVILVACSLLFFPKL